MEPEELSFHDRVRLARKKALSDTALGKEIEAEKQVSRQIKDAERKVLSEKNKKQKTEAEANRDIKRRVKEIAKERKIKQYNDERGFEPDAERMFGDPKGPKQKKLLNRPLDLENKIPVRVDHKTIVFVKPGTDINKIIAKYKKNGVKDRFDDQPPAYQF